MNQSNWMIPGARENWRSLLYKESKNIENRRVLFAGDDFEKYFRKILTMEIMIFSHNIIIFNIFNNNPYI